MDFSQLIASLLFLTCLGGCASSRSVHEHWIPFYDLHASSVQRFAKQELDGLSPGTYREKVAICGIRGIVFWPYAAQPWVAGVHRAAASGDFRPGDRIVAINGISVNYLESLLSAISEHRDRETLRLTVRRRERIHVVEATCRDNRPLFEATTALLEAAARGQWGECSELAEHLAVKLQVAYSWLLELKEDCREATRLLSRRPATDEDARGVYHWALLRINEARNIPGGLAAARGGIQAGVAWLRRNHFDSLAEDLMANLDAYTVPYEYE